MRVNEVILAYSRLPRQLPAQARAHWRARLQPARGARLSADAHAQSRSLLGIALACALLGRASGRRVEPAQMRYSANGKPYVAGLAQFSIAHAGAWVLCAMSSHGAVGVDIEPLRALAALPRWHGVFDEHERRAARSASAALLIWTAKEAALKAAGARFSELPRVQVRGARVEFRGRRWYARTPRLHPRMVVRLVSERPVARLRVQALCAAAALAP